MNSRFWCLLLCCVTFIAEAGLEIGLFDREGRPERLHGKIRMETKKSSGVGGMESVRVTLKSDSDEDVHANITASILVKGAKVAWDGVNEVRRLNKPFEKPLLANGSFLMGAAWGDSAGVAIALGADDLPSFADLSVEPSNGDVKLKITVPAAFLRKGAGFECTFHEIPFSPKYGIRDAIARYYPLYPERFKRDPRVNPAVYGISAEYSCWKDPNPELCRLMNASWEWCHGAGRSWGDPLNLENPTGENYDKYAWAENLKFAARNGKRQSYLSPKLTREEFDTVQGGRMANALYCGVLNGFYMMAVANISDVIAERYPDSVAVGETCARNDYPYSTEVYTFPECSWGQELRRQLAKLVEKHDIGAIAFDVSRPRSIYRGAKLKEMDNVGWDGHGPGVVRGIGSGKLFDFIKTLKNKNVSGNCGVIVNSKYEHLSDILRMDTMMMETEPWSRKPPFPMALRYALGEKALTMWEGYSPRAFAPDYNSWTEEDQHLLLRDLSRYAVHRSLATGASLPVRYITEYVSMVSSAFVRMNDAGWKAVPGFTAEGGGWETARYGSGLDSYLVICNETNASRRAKFTVYPNEIASDCVGGAARGVKGYMYVPFFGGSADIVCDGAGMEQVECETGRFLVNVLEAAGTIDGNGQLNAKWSGDYDAVKLSVKSADFAGSVNFKEAFGSYVREGGAVREFVPGKSIEVLYRNTEMPGLAAKVRKFTVADGKGRPAFVIQHAEDGPSKDMADRIEFFFRSAMTPKPTKAQAKKIEKNGRKQFVAIRKKAEMSPLTVVLSPKAKEFGTERITVSAPNAEELSRKVRRMLDVMNLERFPEYGAEVKMPPEDKAHYPFRRL